MDETGAGGGGGGSLYPENARRLVRSSRFFLL